MGVKVKEFADLSESKKAKKRKSEVVDEVAEQSIKKKKKKKEKEEKEESIVETNVNKEKKKVKDKEAPAETLEAGVDVKKKRKKNKRKGKKLGKGDKENPSDIGEENTAKFKLSVSKTSQDDVVAPAAALDPLNQGKGPKIIIAQEEKPVGTKTKRKKGKKKDDEEEVVHETKGMNKALAYLSTWKTDKGNWKFEKCRQIWLIHNAYDNRRIKEETFPVLLEYMQSIKGGMRTGLIDAAKKILDKAELVGTAEEKVEEKDDKDDKEEDDDDNDDDTKAVVPEKQTASVDPRPSEIHAKRAKLIQEALSE